MKLWGIVWIQVRNSEMITIKQIIEVVECRYEDMNKVYREHIAPFHGAEAGMFRQIDWFLREPPLPWEKKETKRNV